MVKVRNAIHALQEMTYSTMTSQTNLNGRFPPARSIPNLPNEGCSTDEKNEPFGLARSSSQPAEMWVHDLVEDLRISTGNDAEKSPEPSKNISVATQTDHENDTATIENLISSNRHLVFSVLGISESTHAIADDSQTQQLVSIPEFDVLDSPKASRVRHGYGSR